MVSAGFPRGRFRQGRPLSKISTAHGPWPTLRLVIYLHVGHDVIRSLSPCPSSLYTVIVFVAKHGFTLY